MTNTEPTKSALVGVFCQALGRDFKDDVSDLAALTMHFRVDREGLMMRDFNTVMGVPEASEPDPPVLSRARLIERRKATSVNDVAVIEEERGVMVTHRYYLQDASFLAGVEGDIKLLEKIEDALVTPMRAIWLGRKSCPPSRPLWVPKGLLPGVGAIKALTEYPWAGDRREEWVRLVVDLGVAATAGEIRRDHPISLNPNDRRFAPRRIEMRWLEAQKLPKA